MVFGTENGVQIFFLNVVLWERKLLFSNSSTGGHKMVPFQGEFHFWPIAMGWGPPMTMADDGLSGLDGWLELMLTENCFCSKYNTSIDYNEPA